MSKTPKPIYRSYFALNDALASSESAAVVDTSAPVLLSVTVQPMDEGAAAAMDRALNPALLGRYVVIGSNNDGGHPAVIVASLDEAREYIRATLRECEDGLSDKEWRDTEADLANLTGQYVESVKGSETWKERFYVAPLDE